MNSVCSAILNGAILSLPLTAAVWLALRLTPRRALNAATRYAIWWVSLAAVLALPGFFPAGRSVHPASSPVGTASVGWQVMEIQPGVQPAPQSVRPPALPRLPLELPAGAWMRWLLAAWIVASTVLMLRLLLSLLTVCRAAMRASDVPRELRERARSWHFTTRSVRLAASAGVPVPVAAGPFHPTILLPVGLLSQLDRDELEPIVLHEAAHLARRDDCALLLERLLEAIFSLHPAVRWITRQIDLEREIACDDLVVEAIGHPHRYADCLTRAVALCGGVRGSLAVAHASGNRSHLSQRVELLVASARQTGARLKPIRLSPFVVGVVALALASLKAPEIIAFASRPPVVAAATAPLAAPAPTPPVPPAGPPPTPTPTPQAQAPVQPATVGRQLVFFFDTTTFTAADQARAVAAARKFVLTQLQPTDKVAVMVFASRIQVMRDFTADHDLLAQSLQQVGALAIPETPTSTEGTSLAALETAVKMLGPVSGKKALLYLASGMALNGLDNQAQLQATINAAIRANVAFYPIDTRGLTDK